MDNIIFSTLNIIMTCDCESVCNGLISNFIAFLNWLCSLGLLFIGYKARTDWQNKIKGEKFEDTKKELVYSIIDFVALLRSHCNEAITVSQISELNPNIYKEIGSSVEANCKERFMIDSEITNKFRLLSKNLSLFTFYSQENNHLLIKILENFKDKLWEFAQKVNILVIQKFSMYAHSHNEHFRTTFGKSLETIQKKLTEIENQKEEVLSELKGI